MAESRRGWYPPEYRERMINLVRAGSSPGSLAREFGPSEQTLRNCVRMLRHGSQGRESGSIPSRRVRS